MMGSERDNYSQPVHSVTFSQPFYLGRTEVTFREWDACVADGGCNGYRPADQGWGREARPVINVSWHDAQAYVAWLSGRVSSTCRLPSEAEWEYAARAGTTAEYALPAPDGSDDIKGKGLANCLDCGSEWDGKKTTPAGQFPSNSWGLQDMHGNIFEWVEDCLHADYQGGPVDGTAWLEANGDECGSRVLRGGSWYYDLDYARSAGRDWLSPDGRDLDVGFRVLCSSPILEH
jgi:formylglycine-generating enzyme required for sulfatase activity